MEQRLPFEPDHGLAYCLSVTLGHCRDGLLGVGIWIQACDVADGTTLVAIGGEPVTSNG